VSSFRLPSANILLITFAVALADVLAVPAMADSTFQDSTFNLSNYTQTSTSKSDPLSTLSVSRCAVIPVQV
jgi:hypothetical protein